MRKRTLLIGLDGATFTILDPLMRDGVMPFLKTLVDGGVRAPLRSVVPALTPPAWTSLATGRSPGQHGIFDFFCKESAQSPQIRIADSRDVRTETIWTMSDRNGLRTTALNFPLMFPAPRINGFVVPGWMPWRQLRLGCHPPELFDRLKSLPQLNTRELAMDMSIEAKAIEGCRPEEYEDWVRLHIRREQQWFRVLEHLMQQEPCELTAILFEGVDKLQHLCWRFIDPVLSSDTDSDWERHRGLCLDYYRELDGLIARAVKLAGADTTVLLASDHGFGAQTGTFFVNAWLEQQGHLAWSGNEVPRTSDPTELGIGQLARHVFQLDWNSTRAYAPTPSSNGINIVVAGRDGDHGLPQAEYERFRDELIAALYTIKEPATGEQLIKKVYKREEVFDGPCLAMTPDLTLELHDGGLVSILASDTAYKPREVPTGTHRPEGIFIGHGPGWRQGLQLPELSILDVAPVLLHSLDLGIPTVLEGQVPEQAFEPGWLETHPLRSVAAERSPDSAAADSAAEDKIYTEEDELKLMQHLRALGYIE